MGSKSRIADDIVAVISKYRKPNQIVADVFCGGCSIIERFGGHRIANDNNPYLIAMWKELVYGNGVNEFPRTISRNFYSSVRDSYNNGDDTFSDAMKGWVGFMGSYNGRFFDGGYAGHEVKTKSGGVRDYVGENIRNTLAQIPNLRGVQFMNHDFTETFLPVGIIIYCDIPYRGTKQYSTSKNFDYERFYEWCREMRDKGNTVFVSEYSMPDDFRCIWSKEIATTINQTKTKRPTEKLFILD